MGVFRMHACPCDRVRGCSQFNFRVLSGAEELSRRLAWPAEGWPAGDGPQRLCGAGDWRNAGGIDGRRRLTGRSPTATAEPIDKDNALIACDRVQRIRRHQCTQVLEDVGSRMRRSRCGGAACGEAAGTRNVPREGWNPGPCVGDGGGLDRGGALEQGRARDRGRPRQKLSATHSVQPGRSRWAGARGAGSG